MAVVVVVDTVDVLVVDTDIEVEMMFAWVEYNLDNWVVVVMVVVVVVGIHNKKEGCMNASKGSIEFGMDSCDKDKEVVVVVQC